ncbi:MAG: hypothetical protein K0U41_03465 [Gammaproteobacteria bacterium]|nr:hypothetical protein [Gammaproteobacteria bacterium]
MLVIKKPNIMNIKNMNMENIKVLPYIVTYIVAQTMQTMKQAAIIVATAVLLVACGGGGGGGGGDDGGDGVGDGVDDGVVEEPAPNEPTQIVSAALVPYNAPIPNSPTLSFDSDDSLTLDENQLAVNTFTQYRLMVEFYNPDAVKNEEDPSKIDIIVPRGNIIEETQFGNAATHGELISLRLPPVGPSLAAPTANVPALTDSSGNFLQSSTGRYTKLYDFALARNLAGTASIEIAVTDRKNVSGSAIEDIGKTMKTFTIEVTPQNIAPSPGLLARPQTSGAPPIVIRPDTLYEDSYPLSPTSASKVTTNIRVFADSNNNGVLNRAEEINLIRITVEPIDPRNANRRNPINMPFLVRADNDVVSYTRHGWGINGFHYSVAYWEPRGFGADIVFYRVFESQDVGVHPTPDATTVVDSNGFIGFTRADFNSTTPIQVTREGSSIVFADSDFLFDNNFSRVLGDTVQLTSINPELVLANNGSYALIKDPSNNLQARIEGISYSLTLNRSQAFNKSETQYDITADFVGGEGSTIIGNRDLSVAFIEGGNDPIFLDLDFVRNGDSVNATRVLEESTKGELIGTLSIEDSDLLTINPGTYTYGFTAGSNSSNLVEWEHQSIDSTGNGNIRSNRLLLTRKVDDVNVGEVHFIAWEITDSNGEGGFSTTLNGNFSLVVSRINDDFENVTLSFTDTGDDLKLNTNNANSTHFNLLLGLSNRDFLENPRPALTNATYEEFDITFDQPHSVNITCNFISSNDSLSALSSLELGLMAPGADHVVTYAADGANMTDSTFVQLTGSLYKGHFLLDPTKLSLADIKATNGCAEIEIGSTITSIGFEGLRIGHRIVAERVAHGFKIPSTVTVNLPANPYVIQGYRNQTHSIAVAPTVHLVVGTTTTINATITDGDPDDGTPAAITNDNVVRPNDGIAAAWTSKLAIDDSACNGVARVIVDDYVAGATGTAQSIATITINASDSLSASSCILIIPAAGEDGQEFPEQTINVIIELPPVVIPIDDIDNDGIAAEDDLDDDGNGLIEIRTAAELNMIRNNLAGTGLSGVIGEQGNTSGCPMQPDGGCSGYELAADIDLADGGYPNWIPIGTASSPFTATLDGNNWTISNLSIYIEHIDNQGLFAAINNAVIRNVHLVGVSVISINNRIGYPGLGGTNIGALAGQAQGASMIINSSASGSTIEGRTNVGGLIGNAANAIIMRSSARFENITGLDGQHIGGLVGSGTGTPIGAQITSSSATIIGRIVGDNNLGGLVGDAANARVRSSVTRVNTIVRTPGGSGKINIGGLLGNAANAVISGSMSIVSFVGDGSQFAGGLIGSGRGATVNASAAITGTIKVRLRHVGGLIGVGTNSKVANSYASTKDIIPAAEALRGGLIGLPHTSGNASDGLAMVANSYWDNITLQVPDSRSFAADIIGVGSGALNTTNTFTGIFAEWGKVYVNHTSGDLETFDIPPDTTPESGTHTQAWNLDAFPEQYPLLNGLPITPAEQNTAIIRVLAGTSPTP